MAGDDLRRHHQHAVLGAGAHQIDGDMQAGGRRRAAEAHVEGRALGAERMLDLDGDRRIGPLVMRGRADHHVDVGRLQAGMRRAPARRSDAELGLHRQSHRRAAPECAAPSAPGRGCRRARCTWRRLDARGIDDEIAVWISEQRLDRRRAAAAFSVSTQAIEAGDQLLIGDQGFGDFDPDPADDDAIHVRRRSFAGTRAAPSPTMKVFSRRLCQFLQLAKRPGAAVPVASPATPPPGPPPDAGAADGRKRLPERPLRLHSAQLLRNDRREKRAWHASSSITWPGLNKAYRHQEGAREHPSVLLPRRQDRHPRPERLRQVDRAQDHGRHRQGIYRRGLAGRGRDRRLPGAGAAARPGQERVRQRHGGRRAKKTRSSTATTS